MEKTHVLILNNSKSYRPRLGDYPKEPFFERNCATLNAIKIYQSISKEFNLKNIPSFLISLLICTSTMAQLIQALSSPNAAEHIKHSGMDLVQR